MLGAALGGAGHAIVGIATVSDEGRDRADAMLPGVPILAVPDLVERSELVILAVPDAELADLVAGLAATGAWQPGQLVAHTAPGFGTAVLAPALAAGAIPLAIHPAMAFTGTSIDLVRLRESWCAVTAPAPCCRSRRRSSSRWAPSRSSSPRPTAPAYAEAIATARSFSAAIVGRPARRCSRGIGVERPGALLGPLVRSAVENALGAASQR